MLRIGSFQRLVLFEIVRLEKADDVMTCAMCGRNLGQRDLAWLADGELFCSLEHADEYVRNAITYSTRQSEKVGY